MTRHAGASPAAGSPMAALAWWGNPSLDAWLGGYAEWMRNVAWLQEESLRFAGERFQRSVETAASLAGCTSPGEFLAVQARYASEMLGDCVAEWGKVAGVVSR